MRHQEIIFGVAGQSFYYDPPEGRPSGTPTVSTWIATQDDDQATEAMTTGAASVDAVNTTLSTAGDAGSNTFVVASATGIARGRRYLLTNAAGERELIDVSGASGTTITSRRPLFNDYGIGSTFVGCRITIAVDASWVSNKAKLSDVLDPLGYANRLACGELAPGTSGYRLRWAYTVDGVATIGVSFADLVRYQSKNLVTALDIADRFPGWIDRLPPDHQDDQGAALIADAFHDVRNDALADAQILRRIRSTDVVRELVVLKANVRAVENQVIAGSATEAAVKLARELYRTRFDQLIREPKVPVDQGGGGASGVPARLPVWRR